MRSFLFAVIAILPAIVGASSSARAAMECPTVAGRDGASVAGEISGERDFREATGPGWTLALLRDAHGWNLRLLDQDGLDLTQFTPPLRFPPNPREIYGWHFRNVDNTGPNDGSVNAPQRMRAFVFASDPAAIVRVTATDGAPPNGPIAELDGRGMLEIVDYGLSDLEPGQTARMTWLKFRVCLNWPAKKVTPAAEEVRAGFLPDETERIRACGLAPEFTPHPYLRPLTLDGDFDGDGTLDMAVPVVRDRDGKRALAICRAGTVLDVVGLEGRMGHLVPEYFDRMDHWSLHPRGEVNQGVAEGAPPILTGDAILLALEEKSSVLLYWNGVRYQAYWQGD